MQLYFILFCPQKGGIYMRVIAFNGSPRKSWNTHMLLEKALEGAKDGGAKTQMIHLFSLNYTGCISCFACEGTSKLCTGKCVLADDLKPILHSVDNNTAIIIGSPIYLGDVTGATRNMMERLMHQYHSVDYHHSHFFGNGIKTAMIYTMGATEEESEERGQEHAFYMNRHCLKRVFGYTEELIVYDTYQHADYSKYYTFPGVIERKTARRKTQFLNDLQAAYELGLRFAKPL